MAEYPLPPSRTRNRHELQVIRELRALRAALDAAKPPPPRRWYERMYSIISNITKYVGIPGLIIAAIAPLGKLSSDLIEHNNKSFVQTTYIDYASELLKQGFIDRANKLLTILEAQKDFDTKEQYYKAKTLIAMAIQQGRNYPEAYDTAMILSLLEDNKSVFFPSFGGIDDVIDLKMALIDIDIAQQRYKQARGSLRTVAESSLARGQKLQPNIDYRYGVLDVLQFSIEGAKKHLERAAEDAERTSQNLLSANVLFQLAKANQFGGNNDAALKIYQSSANSYEALGDKYGLIRTYNNIAMIYSDSFNDNAARKYYNMEQNVAREVGDELGYARATMNLATIEKRDKTLICQFVCPSKR